MHILIVEDEKKVASFLQRGLAAEHYEVDVVHDGNAGLERALERRGAPSTPPTLSCADLVLDPATHNVTRADRKIELTAREYALLEFFLRNTGRVLSRAVIAQRVWGLHFDTLTNVIDVYVNYLRRKIDTDSEPKLLHTVRGTGYVLRAPEA